MKRSHEIKKEITMKRNKSKEKKDGIKWAIPKLVDLTNTAQLILGQPPLPCPSGAAAAPSACISGGVAG